MSMSEQGTERTSDSPPAGAAEALRRVLQTTVDPTAATFRSLRKRLETVLGEPVPRDWLKAALAATTTASCDYNQKRMNRDFHVISAFYADAHSRDRRRAENRAMRQRSSVAEPSAPRVTREQLHRAFSGLHKTRGTLDAVCGSLQQLGEPELTQLDAHELRSAAKLSLAEERADGRVKRIDGIYRLRRGPTHQER